MILFEICPGRMRAGALSPAAAFLLLLGSTTLAGCGRGEKPPIQADGGKPAADGSLARVKKAGAIRWGADSSGGAPFVFNDPNDPDKVIGFEVDLVEKFAVHMGVKAERIQADWAGLLDDLRTGARSDIVVNGIEINEERKKKNAFSQPYYLYEQQLTVRVGDKEKYGSLDALKGKPVGILNAAEAGNVLKNAGWTDDLIKEYPDSLQPYVDLKNKRTEAVLQESIIAAHYAGKDAAVFNVPKTFGPGKYAVVCRPEDQALLVECDRILDLMKKNGDLAAIYRKWGIWTDGQKEIGVMEGPEKAPEKKNPAEKPGDPPPK